MKKVAMVIGFEKFRDEEFFEPYHILKSAGLEVNVFSSQLGVAHGKMGGNWKVTHLLSDLDMHDYDTLLLVGGPGGYSYIGSPLLQSIIHKGYDEGKLLTAICMAPQLLAESGLMKGVNATIFPGDAGKLTEFGANYIKEPVVISLPFITADGPSSATKFGQTIVEQMNT